MESKSNGPLRDDYCVDCGLYFHTDIFRWRGIILCGECRYIRRTGRLPPRGNTCFDLSEKNGDQQFHGGFGSETLGRFRNIIVRSAVQVRVLMDIDRDRGD